jgi:hypothetical protein
MMPMPGLFVLGAVLVIISLAFVAVRLGQFLSKEGPEAPQKSAADLVAELAAQETTSDRVKSLFFEGAPALPPVPVVAQRSGTGYRMVLLDERGQELASFDLRKS